MNAIRLLSANQRRPDAPLATDASRRASPPSGAIT